MLLPAAAPAPIPLPVVGADPGEARAAAGRELAKPIYHRQDESLPLRVVRAVEHWLAHAFSAASQHSPGGSAGLLVLLAAVVVLVVLVARVVVRPTGQVHRPVLSSSSAVLTAAEHRALAMAAAAAGDWDTAVLERMRAVTRELEEQGVIEDRAGRTATEVARDGSVGRPPAGPALTRAAQRFDRVVYGRITARAEDHDVVAAADELVRRRSAAATAL